MCAVEVKEVQNVVDQAEWALVVGEEKEEIARCFLHADHSL